MKVDAAARQRARDRAADAFVPHHMVVVPDNWWPSGGWLCAPIDLDPAERSRRYRALRRREKQQRGAA